ncbi:IS110 family transposase [Rhodococcus wratislaviensis]|uniref:IS110 family transposase n=1 Tax=Rhodococcus wratislaviensis TaxID=44752 RepID=UPI000F55CE70|nr:IS110 family transposase [Rhodococcus wratislaviensis]
MLLVGDDWAEDHHDVELMDSSGRTLTKSRLPEGSSGIARLHALIAAQLGDDAGDEAEVRVGIETDRGPWVAALNAAGYVVYPVNPLQAARFRQRHAVSGAKSDAADAHTLADMVRTDAHQLRAMAGDSPDAEAVKVVARVHKTLIWERTRQTQRLRHALREYFPATLEAFDAPDTLELLGKAPDPAAAARLSRAQISAALRRARRRDIDTKTTRIRAALRTEQLGRPGVVTAAYAATTRAAVAVLATLNEQITALEAQVDAHFHRHPDAEIVLSQPGLATVLGARVLAEFGDDPTRYVTAKNRKNYAGTSPITRASGKRKLVAARYVHNDRLVDALMRQAQSALQTSPGARAYYDRQRARGLDHNPALRQLANRLVGILHGCLKTRTHYDETTAWSHHVDKPAA